MFRDSLCCTAAACVDSHFYSSSSSWKTFKDSERKRVILHRMANHRYPVNTWCGAAREGCKETRFSIYTERRYTRSRWERWNFPCIRYFNPCERCRYKQAFQVIRLWQGWMSDLASCRSNNCSSHLFSTGLGDCSVSPWVARRWRSDTQQPISICFEGGQRIMEDKKVSPCQCRNRYSETCRFSRQ